MANNEVKITFSADASGMFNAAEKVRRTTKTTVDSQIADIERLKKASRQSAAELDADLKRIQAGIRHHFTVREIGRSETIADLAGARQRQREFYQRPGQYERAYRGLRDGGVSGYTPSAGEMRYGRINLARQGADVFTQLGSGQGLGITAVQQGPQIIEAMAMSGGKLAAAMTATKAAVIAMAPVMAAGAAAVAVAYKWTNSIREESERRLKIEEQITGAANRQYLLRKQITDARREEREIAERQSEFDRRIGGVSDIAALERERATLERLGVSTMPVWNAATNKWDAKETSGSEARGREIAALDERIRSLRAANAGGQDRRFADDFKNWQKMQAARAEAERKFAESVKKAQEQANDLGETWRDVFRSLSIQQGSDNPFVKVFFDADDAITKLKASIKGLPLEMQAAALASQRAFNATQLFGEQVNSAFRAFDLRETAARFRDGDGSERRNLRQTSLDRYIADFERTRSSRNVRANEEYIARVRRSIGQDGNLTAQERLDRQLSIIGGFSPRNGQEQSILDRRVLGIASGLNPADLRNDQRDAIAAAAERQAEVEARSQMEGLKAQQASAAFLQNISAYVDELKQTATKGGTAALNSALNITVRDETKDGVRTERIGEGTQADVAANYGLFGGGSGGLTSF